MGLASFKVLALFTITDSIMALSLRSSRSGMSIASLAATHFSEVFSAGMTEGPHSLWSRASAYFKILSMCNGKGSKLCIDAHNSYLSNERMWTAIVLGAPERRTSCLSLSISEPDRSSDWSSSVRSLAAAPARLPIASRRAAQRAFSAFSLSNNGVLEDWSGSGFSLFFGAVGLATRALIAASFLRAAKGRSSFDCTLCSQSPNPNCWVDDSKNNFSEEMTNDQNCSSMIDFWRKISDTPSTNVSAIAPTFAVNSLCDRAPKAITNVGFDKGVLAIASENDSSKTGNDKILKVQRSIWAMMISSRTDHANQTSERLWTSLCLIKCHVYQILTNIRSIWAIYLPGNILISMYI